MLKSMEIQSGHSELFVISQVSAIEGCPLSGIPLYFLNARFIASPASAWTPSPEEIGGYS